MPGKAAVQLAAGAPFFGGFDGLFPHAHDMNVVGREVRGRRPTVEANLLLLNERKRGDIAAEGRTDGLAALLALFTLCQWLSGRSC